VYPVVHVEIPVFLTRQVLLNNFAGGTIVSSGYVRSATNIALSGGAGAETQKRTSHVFDTWPSGFVNRIAAKGVHEPIDPGSIASNFTDVGVTSMKLVIVCVTGGDPENSIVRVSPG